MAPNTKVRYEFSISHTCSVAFVDSFSTLHMHDRGGQPIDRTPPAAGQALSRVNANNPSKTDYWCPPCLRWGNHDESGHGAWQEQMRSRPRGRSHANNNSSTPTPGSTPAIPTTGLPSSPLMMPRTSYTAVNF